MNGCDRLWMVMIGRSLQRLMKLWWMVVVLSCFGHGPIYRKALDSMGLLHGFLRLLHPRPLIAWDRRPRFSTMMTWLLHGIWHKQCVYTPGIHTHTHHTNMHAYTRTLYIYIVIIIITIIITIIAIFTQTYIYIYIYIFICVCVEHLNRCKTSYWSYSKQGSGGHSWSHHSTKTLQVCCDMQSGRRLHVPASPT